MERNVIDLRMPTSWEELTQTQLRYVYMLMTRFADAEMAWVKVATQLLLRYGNIRIVTPYGEGWLIRRSGKEFYLETESLTAAAMKMRWLQELPQTPVRLDSIGGCKAVAPDIISELPFLDWIACDNLYQGYIFTLDDQLLAEMANILYGRNEIKPSQAELISVCYWWAAVKQMVAGMFPHFMHPSPAGREAEAPDADELRRSADAQIRALTKGDITKEEQVLEMPAIRALTELDALAREYEELNKKYPSKN